MENKKGFSVLAVFVGWLAGSFGSFIVAAILGVVTFALMTSVPSLKQTIGSSQWSGLTILVVVTFALNLIGELIFYFASGYIAARLAGAQELKHGLYVALATLAVKFGLLSFIWVAGLSANMFIKVPMFVPYLIVPIILIPLTLLGSARGRAYNDALRIRQKSAT